MLQSSKDLLFLVLAIAILWLTVFLSIILYYLLNMARQGSKIAAEWRARFGKIDEFISAIKGKVNHSTALFISLAEGIKQVLDFIKTKRETKKKK